MAEKIIIEVGMDNAEYAKKATDTLKAMQDLKDQQVILASTGKKNTLEYEQNKVKLQEMGRELKANVALSNNYTSSMVGMRAQLSVLNAQWARMSDEQRENTEEGKALAAQMLNLTNKLKEQEKGVGDTRRNVGNYAEAVGELKDTLLGAVTSSNAFSQVTEHLPIGFQIGKKAIDAASDSIQAYRQSQEEVKQAQEAYEKAQTIATEATEKAAEAEKIATEIGFKYGQGTATKQEVIKATTVAQEAATTAQEANVAVTQASTAAQEANTAAVGLGTTALKVFRVALAATGIGLVIVLFASLISYMTKFQPVIDAVKKATAGLAAGFQMMGKILFELISPLQKVFKDPLGAAKDLGNFIMNNLINRFKALGVIIDGIINLDFKKITNGTIQLGTGVEDATDKMKNFSKSIADAARSAADLQDQQNKLDRDRINNIATSKELIRQEEALKNIRDNEFNSIPERIAANEKAAAIEKRRLQELEALQLRQVRILQEQAKLRGGLSKISNEELQKLREAELELADLREESVGRENEFITNRFQLQKEASEKAKEVAEKYKEADQERLESLIRTNETILTERQKDIDSINREIDEKVKLFRKYNRTTEQLEKERAARLAEIRKQFHEEDLQAIEENYRQIEDLTTASIKNQGERELQELRVNGLRRLEDQDKVIKDLIDRRNKGEKGLSDLINSEMQVRNAMVEDNIRQMNEKTDALDQERITKAMENELALTQARAEGADSYAERLMYQQQYLDQEYELAVTAAIARNEDTYAIHEEFAAKQKALDQEVWASATDAINDFGDNFQGVVGQNTKAAQLAAALQTKAEAALFLQQNARLAIEQLLGITSQLKQPFPLNVVAVAGTLALVARIASAAKSLVTVPKYSGGGLHYDSDGKGTVLRGPGTGTSDSMNARVSNGEVIINEKSSKMFLPILSAINTAGGGRPLIGPGSNGYKSVMFPRFNSGGMYQGIASTYVGQAFDTEALAAAIASQFRNVTIVTDVRDVTSAQQKRSSSNHNRIV